MIRKLKLFLHGGVYKIKKLIYYCLLTCKINRVFLFNTPSHGNLGDHAIVKGELEFLKNYFPNKSIIEISGPQFEEDLNYIKLFIQKKDILFLHGGGYIGTLWLQEEYRFRKMLNTFKKNKIIVFPQTAYFSDDEEGNNEFSKSKEIYSNHKNLYVMLRDYKSYDFFVNNFESVKSYYFPDMVTFLEDNYENEYNNKVLLCLRSDKEKNIDKDIFENIELFLVHNNETVAHIDTVLNRGISSTEREEVLTTYLNNYGSSKLVITDRLHGMIFAAITGTPCIAFDNISKKVSGVYEWIKSLEYIRMVDSYEEFVDSYNVLTRISSKYIYSNPNKNEFEKMAQLIKSIIQKRS